jgi:hypothetical protein
MVLRNDIAWSLDKEEPCVIFLPISTHAGTKQQMVFRSLSSFAVSKALPAWHWVSFTCRLWSREFALWRLL